MGGAEHVLADGAPLTEVVVGLDVVLVVLPHDADVDVETGGEQ